jgi:SAM-dependent methyltransferase
MRSCPICQTSYKKSKLFLKEKIDHKALSQFSYASRKNPEFMRHNLMQCPNCDLVYVSNPPKKSDLANAYHISDFDSSEEANDAAKSYLESITEILAQLPSKESALEIGSGTGIFLEHLKKRGFSNLVGIEPSSAAINAAPKHRKKWLRKGIFVAKDFKPNTFDLICCFMTMEHVHDPLITALDARKLLKPGGLFVTVTHDYRNILNKILGENSPIIDIEHMQIFSDKSIKKTFEIAGYKKIMTKTLSNTYSLAYWFKLTPIPNDIKNILIKLINIIGIGKLKLKLNVGNTISWGSK